MLNVDMSRDVYNYKDPSSGDFGGNMFDIALNSNPLTMTMWGLGNRF
jgi:hypothetical protein